MWVLLQSEAMFPFTLWNYFYCKMVSKQVISVIKAKQCAADSTDDRFS